MQLLRASEKLPEASRDARPRALRGRGAEQARITRSRALLGAVQCSRQQLYRVPPHFVRATSVNREHPCSPQGVSVCVSPLDNGFDLVAGAVGREVDGADGHHVLGETEEFVQINVMFFGESVSQPPEHYQVVFAVEAMARSFRRAVCS